MCEALNRLTPGDHEKRSALFNSGAEAVENAVKIARAYTKRDAVVVFEHGYHGRTNLTMAMTAKNMPYKHSFGPFAPEVYRVPMSYPFHDGRDGAKAAADAISRIDKEIGADNVAAIVIEPIEGEGGFIVPAEGFLPALVEFANANGIVFVADEIQTGFCRTGDWFACEHEGIVPDLITTAKGIAGGLPLAGVTGRAEIMDAVHAGGLGGTYGGNPVACAAALGSIATMEELDLNAAARAIEAVMMPRLQTIADKTGVIGDIRGRGAMIAVEIVKPGTDEPDADAHRRGRQGLPRAGRRGPHGRHLRQRAALPAAAHHARPPARRGPHRPRGAVPGPHRPLSHPARLTSPTGAPTVRWPAAFVVRRATSLRGRAPVTDARGPAMRERRGLSGSGIRAAAPARRPGRRARRGDRRHRRTIHAHHLDSPPLAVAAVASPHARRLRQHLGRAPPRPAPPRPPRRPPRRRPPRPRARSSRWPPATPTSPPSSPRCRPPGSPRP